MAASYSKNRIISFHTSLLRNRLIQIQDDAGYAGVACEFTCRYAPAHWRLTLADKCLRVPRVRTIVRFEALKSSKQSLLLLRFWRPSQHQTTAHVDAPFRRLTSFNNHTLSQLPGRLDVDDVVHQIKSLKWRVGMVLTDDTRFTRRRIKIDHVGRRD